jgi:addiction module HigA family antidote
LGRERRTLVEIVDHYIMAAKSKRLPVHPGRILKHELEAAGFTAEGAPRSLQISAEQITEIIDGRRSISADTALRLGKFFGTSAQMWMNLQSQYDLQMAQD